MSDEIVTRALAGLATGLADDDIDALVQMAADFGVAAERLWAVHGRIGDGCPRHSASEPSYCAATLLSMKHERSLRRFHRGGCPASFVG